MYCTVKLSDKPRPTEIAKVSLVLSNSKNNTHEYKFPINCQPNPDQNLVNKLASTCKQKFFNDTKLTRA